MDILAWIWWSITTVLGAVWSLAWFLIGGWVSTLAQIAVIVGIIFFYKYGWRRAPYEILARINQLRRLVWGWMRQREPGAVALDNVREVIRTVRVKERGDVNISTLMSLMVLTGFALVALT